MKGMPPTFFVSTLRRAVLAFWLAPFPVIACGLDWTLPQAHFEGVEEHGFVSYWEKVGEIDLGNKVVLPVNIGFNSHREASSPVLGKGWIVALLESHVEPIDENAMNVIMPDGWTFLFLRNANSETWRGNAGWMGETNDARFTISAPCGWKITYDRGKIQEIDGDQIGALTFSYIAAASHKTMKQADNELEMKKDVDLGIILDTTSPVQLALPIVNRSTRVITITDVAKDCSCTSVKIDKLKLAPGETATLRVVANLAGKTDLYQGNLIVESDAVEKIDQIHLHGLITGQIRIRPGRVTVLTGDQQTPGTFSVFCDDQNGKWRYTGFVADDPHLVVQIKPRATSPTTSVYDGTVDIASDTARRNYGTFQTALVTLTFINDKLGRRFDLKYGVDVALRRNVTVDPPQVMFLGDGTEQRRTLLVQSPQAFSIDAANCSAPGIRATLRRVNAKAVKVDLLFQPSLGSGRALEKGACELVSGGKTIGSVPINIVEIR
jgi:hypothetical protein